MGEPTPILCVVNDATILDTLSRLFVSRDIRVLRAESGEEALGIVRGESVAVVVAGNLLPEMRGVELLSQIRDLSPDTVRVLLTGHADLPVAIEATHRGVASRFLEKPWLEEEIVRTVEGGVRRYQVVRSLRHADEAALLWIAQEIELKDPYTRGHCDRVAASALKIAGALHLPEGTRRAIKHGSWLHDCGKIDVPEGILNYPGKLSTADFEVIKKHPGWGAEITALFRRHLAEAHAKFGLKSALRVTPTDIRERYRKRFGIETSYRQRRQGRIYTCTRDPHLRLFFVALAFILRNVWVWIHQMHLAEGAGDTMTLHLELLRFKRMLDWIVHEVMTLFHDGPAPYVTQPP